MATTSWYTLRSGCDFLRARWKCCAASGADLRPDFMAALTVTMVLLPQTMAYALLAGLPAEVGLYSAIIASIVGALWGSSNQLRPVPAALALLSLAALAPIAMPGTPPYLVGAACWPVGWHPAVGDGAGALACWCVLCPARSSWGSPQAQVCSSSSTRSPNCCGWIAAQLRASDAAIGPASAGGRPPAQPGPGLAAIVIIVLLKRLDRRLPGPLIAIVVGAGNRPVCAGRRVVGSLRGFLRSAFRP